MEIVKTEKVMEVNEQTGEEEEYTVNTYDNGVIEKYSSAYPPSTDFKPPLLNEDQELAYKTAANVEMLLALTELNMVS